MFSKNRKAVISVGWWLGIVCVGGLGFGAWGLSKTECAVRVEADRKFALDVDIDTFRQILVRTNATAAIIEHGGMQLVNETTEAVDIDLSNDSRPLRNFLRGKSKANVSATKHLTLRINDPQLNATELLLSQNCNIQPEKIHIVTSSDQPAGELSVYNTILEAVKAGNRIEVTLSMEMTVVVCVPRVFLPQAEARVQQAAEKAMEEQEAAIRSLVAKVDRSVAALTNSKRQSSSFIAK